MPEEEKTPIRRPAARLTPEDIEILVLQMLDNPRVRERLAEAVADVLREHILREAEERRKGSYVAIPGMRIAGDPDD